MASFLVGRLCGAHKHAHVPQFFSSIGDKDVPEDRLRWFGFLFHAWHGRGRLLATP